MPWETAKYFAVLLEVAQGQNLLEHEILPEYKCFVGSGSKLLLPDFFFFFKEIWLSCQQLENSGLQRQLVMKPVSVLKEFSWEIVNELQAVLGSSTISLNTACDHRFGFCNYFVPCFQTQVLDLSARRELDTLGQGTGMHRDLEVHYP